jgi:N-ethylmaleimide reductase
MTSLTTSLALLSQFQLGDLSLENRVVLAPMTRARAGEQRLANEMMAEYYRQRASAGLLITEATVISASANGWQHTPGIYTDEQTEAWKIVTKVANVKGTPIFCQLWHCGRASHSSFHPGQLPIAPSAIAINGEIHTPIGKQSYETPRAVETAEIPGIVEDFRHAAQRAKEAGFDGIEIHGANGYLIDTFLQSATNHREDIYGGSLENRYRFLRDIVEAVLTVFPADRIGVRLSPNGVYNDMGSEDFRETFLYVAQQLNDYKLAYLHLLDGLAFGFHEKGEPMTLAEFRPVFEKALIGNCGYSQETAEAAIQGGNADLIAFGRPYISNPDLVERFANHWPLNPPAEMKDWYSFGKEGYIDFPKYR